ncbi:MAG: hypothetical protein QM737_22915 [Ferruginibacter sp.]
MIFLLITAGALGQVKKFETQMSIILDSTIDRKTMESCSRADPENITGFFQLTRAHIMILQDNFESIRSYKTKECCGEGAMVFDLRNYSFQFVGVIKNSKRYIYINAFLTSSALQHIKHGFCIEEQLIDVCDGGAGYWGALFDIQTKQFVFLAINSDG